MYGKAKAGERRKKGLEISQNLAKAQMRLEVDPQSLENQATLLEAEEMKCFMDQKSKWMLETT